MSFKKIISLIFTLIFLAIGFQNCGLPIGESTHKVSSEGCAIDLLPSFASGHHAFFQKQKCNTCHIPGGIGSGAFAQADLASAFAAFKIRGPAKIRAKLRNGHQSFNFTDIEPDLALAEKIYQDGIDNASCEGDNSNLRTAEKKLVFFEDSLTFGKKRILVVSDGTTTSVSPDFKKIQTIVFDLDDGYFQPSIPGAQLSMDVEVFYESDFFFPTHYLVTNPKIKTIDKKLHIKSVTVLLNGDPHLVTTFQGVDSVVDKGNEFIELDPGGAAAVFLKADDDIYDNTDTWSVQFDSVDEL